MYARSHGRTALPVGAEVAVGLAGVVVGPAAGRGRELGAGVVSEERKGRKREERGEERRPAHFERWLGVPAGGWFALAGRAREECGVREWCVAGRGGHLYAGVTLITVGGGKW